MTEKTDPESRRTERRETAQQQKMEQAPPPLDPAKIHTDPPNAGGQNREAGDRRARQNDPVTDRKGR